jgi:hypothetical protein
MNNEQTESLAVVRQDEDRKVSADEIIARMSQDPACDPAKLRELLAVRREWNADEAAAAFNAAIVRFQQQCPIIPKLDKAYDKLYARIDRIWRTIRPLMEECGLAVTWESMREQGGVMILEGHLRHSRGHAQPVHHEIPLPDLIKGQNVTQRAGSAETYAKRYALCAALGIQTGEDDDGAGGAAAGAPIDAKQRQVLADMLVESGRTEAFVCGLAEVKTLDEVPAADFKVLCNTLQKIIDGNRARGSAGGVRA